MFQSLVVTKCDTTFNIKKFCLVLTAFMCFVWISEQTAIFVLNAGILVFKTEVERVYCVVCTETYRMDTFGV